MDAGPSSAVTPYQSTAHIDDLPDEVLIEIFFYLTKPKQLFTIRAVSSRWRKLASTKWLWNEVDIGPNFDKVGSWGCFVFLSCLKIAPCLRSLTCRYSKCDFLETILENCSSIRRLEFSSIYGNDEVLLKFLHKYKSVIDHLHLTYLEKHSTKLMETLPLMPSLKEFVLQEYGDSDRYSPDLPQGNWSQNAGIDDWPSLRKFSYDTMGYNFNSNFNKPLPVILESLGNMRLKLKELKLGQYIPKHLVQFNLDKSLDLCRHMDVLSISAYGLDLKWDMRDKSWIKLILRDYNRSMCVMNEQRHVSRDDWPASRCLLSVKEILIDCNCCPCTTSLLKGCKNVEKLVTIMSETNFSYSRMPTRFGPYFEPLQVLLKIIEVLPNLKSIVVKASPELVKPLIESKEVIEKTHCIEISFYTLMPHHFRDF